MQYTEGVHEVAIKIEVDGVVYEAHQREMTGEEIKRLSHSPPGNTLYHVKDGQRHKVRDEQTIRLHEGECFITVPPVGHAG